MTEMSLKTDSVKFLELTSSVAAANFESPAGSSEVVVRTRSRWFSEDEIIAPSPPPRHKDCCETRIVQVVKRGATELLAGGQDFVVEKASKRHRSFKTYFPPGKLDTSCSSSSSGLPGSAGLPWSVRPQSVARELQFDRDAASVLVLIEQFERRCADPILANAQAERTYSQLCADLLKMQQTAFEDRTLEDGLHRHKISNNDRLVVVKRMIEVCAEYRLKRETFHLACTLLDRFIAVIKTLPVGGGGITKKDVYGGIGCACLFVAGKMHESPTEQLGSGKLSRRFGTKLHCSEIEHSLLQALDYRIQCPSVFSWFFIMHEEFWRRHDVSRRLASGLPPCRYVRDVPHSVLRSLDAYVLDCQLVIHIQAHVMAGALLWHFVELYCSTSKLLTLDVQHLHQVTLGLTQATAADAMGKLKRCIVGAPQDPVCTLPRNQRPYDIRWCQYVDQFSFDAANQSSDTTIAQ